MLVGGACWWSGQGCSSGIGLHRRRRPPAHAVPDFVDASLAKIIRLRKKLSTASSAVRGLFGAGDDQAGTVDQLEVLQGSIRMVRDLFRDKEATEFVIATIPTVLGVNESARLIRALRKEGIPCKRIVVNQVISEGMGAR